MTTIAEPTSFDIYCAGRKRPVRKALGSTSSTSREYFSQMRAFWIDVAAGCLAIAENLNTPVSGSLEALSAGRRAMQQVELYTLRKV